MVFRCLFNGKKAKAEPSRRQSRFSLCIRPPRSRSASPTSRSPPSQRPERSTRRRRETFLRREGKDDKDVEICSPRLSDLRSRSAVELEEVFKKFDSDGDGKISPLELGDLMWSLGEKLTTEELRIMVSEADLDGDGYIDLTDFVALNSENLDRSLRLQDLEDAFKMFDKDGDGSISPHELLQVLTSLGEPCTLVDCRAMIRIFDRNGDGCINLDDFIAMLNLSDVSN